MLELTEMQKIRSVIAEVLEVSSEQVEPKSNFITDLGADSLRVIEILARVEQMLGISIDQSYLARMISLESVCEIVGECGVEVA